MLINASGPTRLPVTAALFLGFVDILRRKKFPNNIDSKNFGTHQFLRWMMNESSAVSKRIVKLLEEKAAARKKKNFKTMFAYTDSPVLREAGRMQVRQLL